MDCLQARELGGCCCTERHRRVVRRWSAFLTTPFLSLQSVPSDRLVYHIVILAIEGVTMILWFAGFMTLATLSSPNGCNIGNCVALQMVVFSGALEWYVILSLTMIKSMPYP